MVSLAFVISFVASAVALLIGIVIFADIEDELSSVVNSDFTPEQIQLLGQNTASGDEPIATDTTNLASIYTGLLTTDFVTEVRIPISGITLNGDDVVLADDPMYGCFSNNHGLPDGTVIFQLDPVYNSLIGTYKKIAITGTGITGQDIFGCHGLSQAPDSEIWYAIIECSAPCGDTGRRIVSIDPTTGLGTDLTGDTGKFYSTLTTGSDGTIYLGHGANLAPDIHTIDTMTPAGVITADACSVGSLPQHGMEKQWIGWNHVDDSMYRMTGNTGTITLPDGLHLEKIDFSDCSNPTEIGITGGIVLQIEEIMNMSFNTDENLFYVQARTDDERHAVLHTLSVGGTLTEKGYGDGTLEVTTVDSPYSTNDIIEACSSANSEPNDQPNDVGNLNSNGGVWNARNEMTISGLPDTMLGCEGLVNDPLNADPLMSQDGTTYIIASLPNNQRWLAEVCVNFHCGTNGVGTAIGNMTDAFTGLAIQLDYEGGTHLVTTLGENATGNRDGVYEVDKTDGSTTLLCTMDNEASDNNILVNKYSPYNEFQGEQGLYRFNGDETNNYFYERIVDVTRAGSGNCNGVDRVTITDTGGGATLNIDHLVTDASWSTEDNMFWLTTQNHNAGAHEHHAALFRTSGATAFLVGDGSVVNSYFGGADFLHYKSIAKGTAYDTKGIGFTSSLETSPNLPQAFEVGLYNSNNTLIAQGAGSVTVDGVQELVIPFSLDVPDDGIIQVGILGENINYLGDTTVADFDAPVVALTADVPMYACDSTGQGGSEIKEVSKTGVVSNVKAVSISGFSGFYAGCGGLAQDPTDQTWYVSGRDDGTGNNALATIDPTTGSGTLVGDSSDLIMTMAFDHTGVLYAVSGAGGNDPDELQSMNLSTGALSGSICSFNDSHGSQNTLAYNYDTNTMYRIVGYPHEIETVDLTTCAVSGNVAITGLVDNITVMSVTYNTADGLFYMSGRDDSGSYNDGTELYTLTTGGVATLIDHDIDANQYWWRGMSSTTALGGAGGGLPAVFVSDGTVTSSQRTVAQITTVAVGEENTSFAQASNIGLTVLAVLPVALFFALFTILSPRVDGAE